MSISWSDCKSKARFTYKYEQHLTHRKITIWFISHLIQMIKIFSNEFELHLLRDKLK